MGEWLARQASGCAAGWAFLPACLVKRRRSAAWPTLLDPTHPPTLAQVELPSDPAALLGRPLAIRGDVPLQQRHMVWHLKDSDERACAYIAGAAPNRWGNFTAAQQRGRRAAPGAVVPPLQLGYGASLEEQAHAAEVRRQHPLYASIALSAWPPAGLQRLGRSLAVPARRLPPPPLPLLLCRRCCRAQARAHCCRSRARQGLLPPTLLCLHPRPRPPPPTMRPPPARPADRDHQQPAVHHGARHPGPHLRRLLRALPLRPPALGCAAGARRRGAPPVRGRGAGRWVRTSACGRLSARGSLRSLTRRRAPAGPWAPSTQAGGMST